MAGVAGPMLRSHRDGAIRFLLGLLVGGTIGAAVLAIPVYLLGTAAEQALPEQWRLWLLAAVTAGFGLADLTNRTPHVWRQVPQRFIHMMPPGKLGLAWGADLALLVTTQKVVSFLWVTMAAVILLQPAMAVPVLLLVAVLASLPIAAWSLHGVRLRDGIGPWDRLGLPRTRMASGVIMLALSFATAVEAWQL
jgi:hypothetical protein